MALILDPDPVINRKVCKLPGVRTATKLKADRIGSMASVNLAPHRKTGNAHIEVTRIRGDRYGRIDWFVSLVDPRGDALAIEFGHQNSGKYAHVPGRVEGLHVLTDAAFGGFA